LAKRAQPHKRPYETDEHTIALGAAIKTQRKALGLSQQEVADLSAVSVNLLRQIEAGKASAHLSKILDVLSAMGLQFSLTRGKSRIEIKV
jgi:y4mF family transcriptional regulator